jgi:hypothetical protein
MVRKDSAESLFEEIAVKIREENRKTLLESTEEEPTMDLHEHLASIHNHNSRALRNNSFSAS